MTILTMKERDDVKSLLEDHQKACDAVASVGKSGWFSVVFLNHEDDNNSIEIPLNYNISKRVIGEQKDWIEKELAKLGVEIKGKRPLPRA